MTGDLWIRDVAAFTVQVTMIVAAGAAGAFACRVRRPGATLVYWRALLLVCVVLPICQPWRIEEAPSGLDPAAAAGTTTSDVASGRTVEMPQSPRRLADLVIPILIAGIVLRAGWLAIGARTLRRLRLGAVVPVPLPPAIQAAQSRLGVDGRILISDRASGPMTFGLFRPVVILPADVGEMAPHVQEAIAYHELIHVRRRDWLDDLAEEAVRTVLWFHPAVWWLIGRIRLSREQVVDRDVIQLTGSREHYVDALLVMALRASPISRMPAPAFLRRSLLKTRVAHIMQETTMTTRRLIASLTASAAVVGLAGMLAVRSFPLQAQSAVAPTGDPVQVIRGGEHLLHGALPEYPARAIEQKVEGEVVLDVAVDDRGEVSDARVSSGPDELRRAALESVLGWHYAPAAVSNTSAEVVLRFHLPAREAAAQEMAFATIDGHAAELRVKNLEVKEPSELSPPQRTERQMVELRQAIADPNVPAAEKAEMSQKYEELNLRLTAIRADQERAGDPPSNRLAAVRSERVSQSVVAAIMSQTGIKVGDPVTEEVLKRLQVIASREDEHIRVEGWFERAGFVLSFITR